MFLIWNINDKTGEFLKILWTAVATGSIYNYIVKRLLTDTHNNNRFNRIRTHAHNMFSRHLPNEYSAEQVNKKREEATNEICQEF